MCSWGTGSLQHSLFIPSPPAFQLSFPSLSLYLILSPTLSLQCTGVLFCVLNTPLWILIVEYFIPLVFFFFQSAKRNFNHPSLLLYHSLFILLHPTDISCLCGNVLSMDALGIIIPKWTDPGILHCITTRQTTTHFHPHAVSVLTNEPRR